MTRPAALSRSLVFPALAAALAAQVDVPHADRRFSFIDESLHGAAPGEFEFENVGTWSHESRMVPDLERYDFKHELEYGLSPGLTFAVDLAEWHTSNETGEWHTQYDATGAELKWHLMDPRTDTVGLGFKTELGFGPHEIEWENVLIVDKVIGPWEGVYNLLVEVEAEGESTFDLKEAEVGFVNKAGLSYEANPWLFLGGEFLWEIPPEWSWGDRQNFSIGPNFTVHGHEWAITTTALFLADGTAEEAEFQLRVLFEVGF